MSIRLTTPLKEEDIYSLKIGDRVLINGIIYSARDATHRRMFEDLDNNRSLPIDLKGQVIYYVGPTPARPGKVIGSAGPTTATRMDYYTPRLLELGLKGMIGKGYRSEKVVQSIKKNKAVYFMAIGGAGAIASKSIKKAEVIAYQDLGPEAMFLLEVQDFPVIVANDCRGNDIFIRGKSAS